MDERGHAQPARGPANARQGHRHRRGGETEQGKLEGRGSFQLLAEVTKITLDDAGITLADVNGMVTAFSFVESTLMHATTFADYLGMEPGYFASVAVGGATAPLMAVQAALAIDAGLAETVLCVRGDNTRSGISSSGMIAMARRSAAAPAGRRLLRAGQRIGGCGLLTPALHVRAQQLPEEALAAVVATQSEHAALKWNAMLRDLVADRGRHERPMIATPFTPWTARCPRRGGGLHRDDGRPGQSMRPKPVYITGIGEGY